MSIKLPKNSITAAFKERIINSNPEDSLLNIIASSKTYDPTLKMHKDITEMFIKYP